MNKKGIILTIFLTIIIGALILFVGYVRVEAEEPQELYQVYLDGKKIGIILNDQELYDLIDKEGTAIKEKYNVTQVYPPNGLEVKKYISYDTNITNVNDLYTKIKKERPFTINAYTITIKKAEGEDIKLYTLNEEIFKEAINQLIYVFIPKEEYNSYINNAQIEISETGELIEAIYFDETITTKKSYVSTEEKIFVNADDLTQYLLFGTTEKQKTYVVKVGEDVKAIAYNNELNTAEFLIANSEIKSANQLLSPGQIVNIGLINPLVTLSYEKHVVVDEESIFTTEVVYDSSMTSGTRYTKQEGENGINRVTKKVRYINGYVQEAFVVKSDEVKPAVSKIVVKGNQAVNVFIADDTIWLWPTDSNYTITSFFNEYRFISGKRDIHKGIDITGKRGSPIYAAADGVVSYAGWQGNGGKVINIDHGNGYFSEYAHMDNLYVNVGDAVKRGTIIGAMGRTGFATGTHLHLGIWVGKPFSSGAYAVDPLKMYQ